MIYNFLMLDNEYWWGGLTCDGAKGPFGTDSVYELDLAVRSGNQSSPFYVSSKGRYIWSDFPFKIQFNGGNIIIDGDEVILKVAGSTLKEAYIAAMNTHFPFDCKVLPDVFFKTAQYNTWMEYTYNPTQEKVLEYAHAIIDNGFMPGIFIIDEGWHGRYGNWEFDFSKFPDPKAMTDELHSLGFTVMLWVVPTVCADGQSFVVNTRQQLGFGDADVSNRFLRNANGEVALIEWWNGYSAVLDMRNPTDRRYLDTQLKYLIETYGIDGFKFDGGSVEMYNPESVINGPASPDMNSAELNAAWNDFGRSYEIHEFKDTYNGGGKNCIQRIRDRNHEWYPDGINTIIPCAIVQGLTGYPFVCPDMIGGGEWSCTIDPDVTIDEELFVRMAEASALFPMMQISWAPWRALERKNLDIVRKMVKFHADMSGEIIALVRESEKSGEPIIRSLEYSYPGKGYETVSDEFLVGENILVAPVVTPATYEREVVFPEGTWIDENGISYNGPSVQMLSAPIDILLWFRKK